MLAQDVNTARHQSHALPLHALPLHAVGLDAVGLHAQLAFVITSDERLSLQDSD